MSEEAIAASAIPDPSSTIAVVGYTTAEGMWSAKATAITAYLPTQYQAPGPILQAILAFITQMLPTILPLLTGCIPAASPAMTPAEALTLMHAASAGTTLDGLIYQGMIAREVMTNLRESLFSRTLIRDLHAPIALGITKQLGLTNVNDATLMLAA